MERNAGNFGRECLGGPEALEKQSRKICGKKSLEEFAEKFADNFPLIRQIKIQNSTQIYSAQPRDQSIAIPWPSNPCFFFMGKKARETPKETRAFSFGKPRKKRIEKKQGLEGQGNSERIKVGNSNWSRKFLNSHYRKLRSRFSGSLAVPRPDRPGAIRILTGIKCNDFFEEKQGPPQKSKDFSFGQTLNVLGKRGQQHTLGHFLKGRSLKGRCNIRVYVPVCVCVPVCVPRLPTMTPPVLWGWTAELSPHPYMTPHPRSRIRTRKQLHDLPLGRTTP